MNNQSQRAQEFGRLHTSGSLLLPNPWCAGAARLLQTLGFAALGTSSAGAAFSLAKSDRQLSLRQTLNNVAEICSATSLPVTADLQDGFGLPPERIGDVITQAAECGAVGGSIEDARTGTAGSVYSISEAVERLHAALEAAARLPFPFVVTARSDNFFEGIHDLDDTLRRLQAYEECGADVLYAPGLSRLEHVQEVVRAVKRPVNVLLHPGADFDLAQLAVAGVRRVSLGGYLARVALDAMLQAASDLKTNGLLSKPPHLTSAALNTLFDQAA